LSRERGLSAGVEVGIYDVDSLGGFGICLKSPRTVQ